LGNNIEARALRVERAGGDIDSTDEIHGQGIRMKLRWGTGAIRRDDP
jgi:hypothetical protein